MNEKNVLDLTEGKIIYVKRALLLAAIEAKVKNALVPEIDALKEKLTKIVKNRDNAVSLLIALRRDKEDYSENALYVDACIERIHTLELQLEDLKRTLQTLPVGDISIKLTDALARHYGL